MSRFRVLDLSRVRSGPTAVRQLADWGADVIQIEAPLSVEPGDGLGGPRHGPDFQNLHRGKRSLTLDLKASEGLAILRRLVADADVLVENFRPDVKERLGIGPAALRALNPRLVYASISGFGQDGPYALRPGFDQVVQGMGGLMSITGMPGSEPTRAGIPVADLSAGLFCAIGILIALLDREVTGKGQWVDSSLLESQIAMLDFQAARWLIGGEVPRPAGNDHPSMAPMGTYATRDGHINIASAGDPMWRRLCAALEISEALDDPDFANDKARTHNRDRLKQVITAALAKRDTADWVEALNAAAVPSGPIYRIDEVFADPQVGHLGVATRVEQARLGELSVIGQAVRLHDTPAPITQGAPERGADNDAILAGLGYDARDIAALAETGVI